MNKITSTNSPKQSKLKSVMEDYLFHIKLFSKNARLYLLGSFLIGINFQIFQLLLNLYLQESGMLEGDIGQIISFRALGMTLMAIPAGILLSRVRLKPVLIISTILFASFSIFISSSIDYEVLVLFSLLSGMAFAFYRVAAAPFYMRNSTSVERTYLFSVSFGMMLLSGMVGSLFGGKLVILFGDFANSLLLGYRHTMYLGIITGLGALVPFFMIKSARPTEEESKMAFKFSNLKSKAPFYSKVFLCNFLIGLGAGLIIPFLNLYFKDRFDMTPEYIGLSYFIVQFAMFSGSLSGPVLAKRLGLVRTVTITQLASIPFMLVLSYSYFLPFAMVAFVLRGGLMNIGVPLVSNLAMEMSDKSDRGIVNALLMLSWTSSWMIATAIGGTIIENFGYTVTMNITTGLYMMSSILFYFFFRSVETKNNQTPGWTILREGTIR